MSSPNSSLSEGLVSKLTKTEQEVLNILKEGTLDNNHIAKTRQTTIRAVQKIIKNLRIKGALGLSSPIANKSEHTNEQDEHRLHAEQYTIEPITKSENYNSLIGKKLNVDGNTILIHNDIIQYYCAKSFFGYDSWAATAKAMKYHDRVIRTLENDLKCILIKPRSQNITRVKSEYAHIKNGLAKKLEREGEKFRCRASEDGHIWFEIDNSWNFHEAETKGKTAQRDMQKVIEPVFNDMRDNKFYLMSDTKTMIDNLAKASDNLIKANLDYKPMFYEMNENLLKFANAMTFYGEHFKSHAGLIKEGTSIFKKMNKRMEQKKLGEFI